MDVSRFDFDLPRGLIAQHPRSERGTSRLLTLDRETGRVGDAAIGDLPALLREGDVLVLNNTRVFPARLIGRRLPGGSAVECMLIEQIDNERWEALMHPGQRLKPGVLVVFGNPEPVLQGEILERRFHGRRLIRLWRPDEGPVMEAVEEIGQDAVAAPISNVRTSRPIARGIRPCMRESAGR
jgi:S-adenosylmethionine:tRNA ribosyltransferase-isomerase